MTEPKVTEEVTYRTVTSTKGTTTNNKRTIVSRTTNVNAVQVNCYDGDGNLKSKDMDQNSWEERDTHNYEWSGDRRPPAEVEAVLREEEAGRRVFNGECQAIESQDGGEGTVVLTSCNVCNTPSIVWTGTVNESDSNADGSAERSSATQLEGSKWVHSEESVSVTMGKSGGFLPKSFVGDLPGDIGRSLVASDANKEGCNVVVVPLGGGGEVLSPGGATAVQPVVPAVLSPEERRQMRRNLNREMSGKPAAEK